MRNSLGADTKVREGGEEGAPRAHEGDHAGTGISRQPMGTAMPQQIPAPQPMKDLPLEQVGMP